jgi:hypothetical protein
VLVKERIPSSRCLIDRGGSRWESSRRPLRERTVRQDGQHPLPVSANLAVSDCSLLLA